MRVQSRIAKRVLVEHRAIAERLRLDPKPVLHYALSNIERWSRDFDAPRRPIWLVKWKQVLTGPLGTLVTALTADTQTAAHLRARSPFLGFLTSQEHVEILRRIDLDMAEAIEAYGIGWNRYFPPAAQLAARQAPCRAERANAGEVSRSAVSACSPRHASDNQAPTDWSTRC